MITQKDYLEFICTDFEDYFDNLKKSKNEFKYLPWIGKDYSEIDDKVLIVGESVYSWEKGEGDEIEPLEFVNNENFARINVYDHSFRNRKSNKRFFRNIENIVNILFFENKFDYNALWRSVAFHEFVQRPMENKSTRPNRNDYIIGAEVLLDIIVKTKVKYCIFLGTQGSKYECIFNSLKENKQEFSVVLNLDKVNNTYPKIICLENDIKTKIFFIKHPSRFFSFRKWIEFISKYK